MSILTFLWLVDASLYIYIYIYILKAGQFVIAYIIYEKLLGTSRVWGLSFQMNRRLNDEFK